MEKWPWCVRFHFVHLNKRICIVNLLLMLPFCTATSPVRVDGNVCTRLGFITTKESCSYSYLTPLQWRHNGRDSVSNHQPREGLLSRLIRRRSKKTSKLRVTGLCAGNSPETGEFPAQRAGNAENVSIWWRHHDILSLFWKFRHCKLSIFSIIEVMRYQSVIIQVQ